VRDQNTEVIRIELRICERREQEAGQVLNTVSGGKGKTKSLAGILSGSGRTRVGTERKEAIGYMATRMSGDLNGLSHGTGA